MGEGRSRGEELGVLGDGEGVSAEEVGEMASVAHRSPR